jgi:CubicO group peptidase (beta-lactamase class C family)
MSRLLLAAALALPALLPAQVQTTAAAQRLRSYLDRLAADSLVAGTVTVVMQNGGVVFQHASGMADREAGRAMTPTTLFRIASQTKAFTSVAAMILVEEGVMALNDPIAKWIPGFANAMVSVPNDSMRPGRRIVPVRRPITVRDLLTHSAGMSYGRESWLDSAYASRGLGSGAGAGWYFAHKSQEICAAIAPLAELPLAAHPGERYVYGYGSDVLGCLVEKASGMTLDRFFASRIIEPLGLQHTTFCVAPADRERLAAVYSRRDDKLVRAPEGPLGQGDYVDGPCRAFSGGAGLVSTAGDYARFLEMLRLGGTFRGARILSPASVALMTRDHIDSLYRGPEWGFGLGFEVLLDPGKAQEYGEPGRWGWGGAYHSSYWVDPEHELVGVLMVQLMPATGSTLQSRFRTLVYSMLPPLRDDD